MDFKFKKIADDKFNNGANELKLHNWVDNNVGQGENAGFQHFILFSTLFFKSLLYQSWENQGLFG